MTIEVLYFEGCPNHEPTVRRVREVLDRLNIDAEVKEIEVTQDDDPTALKFIGSPTVLINGRDIDPTKRKDVSYAVGCRMFGGAGVPSAEMIQQAVREAADTDRSSHECCWPNTGQLCERENPVHGHAARPGRLFPEDTVMSVQAVRPVQWLGWMRLASLATIIISLVLLVRLLPINRLVNALSNRVDGWGVSGPIIFGAVYVLAAVLFVPGSALTLAAGAVFGLWLGTLIVSIASTTAAALAFLIGRYLARDTVRRWAGKNRKFAIIDRAIGQGGWKVVALLRLSPAVPFSLGNYLFGLTSIRFWPYVLTSWLFMLPGTFMYVYLGYVGRAGLSAQSSGRSPGQWALLVAGLFATIVVTIYVTRLARRAIPAPVDADEKADSQDAAAESPSRRQPWMSSIVLLVLALLLAGGTACAYRNPGRIDGLFGPPVVTMAEKYADSPNGPRFDHSVCDTLVKTHVNAEGFVDYKGLAQDAAPLDQYIQSLAKVPLDQLGRNERLALLINAYNAFTLRLILDHYPVKSIKDIPADKRWDARRWNLGGQVYSLNQIEHELIRPNFKEPRIHFALVCAAVGCPPLRNEAYTGQRLEEQLDAQSRYVHTHDRWFGFDANKNIVQLTSLYDWYGGDFEQSAESVLNFAAKYSPALKAALDGGRKPRVEWLDYDWSLNSRENQR